MFKNYNMATDEYIPEVVGDGNARLNVIYLGHSKEETFEESDDERGLVSVMQLWFQTQTGLFDKMEDCYHLMQLSKCSNRLFLIVFQYLMTEISPNFPIIKTMKLFDSYCCPYRNVYQTYSRIADKDPDASLKVCLSNLFQLAIIHPEMNNKCALYTFRNKKYAFRTYVGKCLDAFYHGAHDNVFIEFPFINHTDKFEQLRLQICLCNNDIAEQKVVDKLSLAIVNDHKKPRRSPYTNVISGDSIQQPELIRHRLFNMDVYKMIASGKEQISPVIKSVANVLLSVLKRLICKKPTYVVEADIIFSCFHPSNVFLMLRLCFNQFKSISGVEQMWLQKMEDANDNGIPFNTYIDKLFTNTTEYVTRLKPLNHDPVSDTEESYVYGQYGCNTWNFPTAEQTRLRSATATRDAYKKQFPIV